MMAGVAVVRFNSGGVLLADDVPILRQYLCESLPAVCIKLTVFQMLHFGVQPFDGFLAAAAKHPRNRPLGYSVNCLDDPQFAFFLPI